MVDTETKRRSVLGMTIMSLAIMPLADGSVGVQDRIHVTGIYAGIAAGEPPVGLQTVAIHIDSTTAVEPANVSDSGNNRLIAGDLEVQGTIFAAGISVTGSSLELVTVTSTYSILSTDDIVVADGTFTVTAPASASIGKTYYVKNKGTGTITLAASSLIDGLASVSLIQNASFHIAFDGITWWIL